MAERAVSGRQAARRGVETRDAIHAAAVELFARRGYHATSMRAIAARANVQPAAIYYWYPGKEAILFGLQMEFMDRLGERVTAAIEHYDRPVLRLAAAVREHVVYHGLHAAEAFVTDSEIRALSEGPRRELIARRDAYQATFGDIIRDGIRDGSLHATDAHVATYAILLQCTGVALWFKPEGPLTLDQVAELHVELVLGSLRATPEAIAEAIDKVSRRPAGEGRSGGKQ